MKVIKPWLAGLTFVVVVLVAVPALAFNAGEPAPDFTLKSLSGEKVSLSDFKGQVVLLKLATTWCPTCKQLSGEISEIGEQLKESNVVFLEIFVQDSEKMIADYIEGKPFPMVFHPLLDDGQAYKAYNVYLIPRLLVIDAGQIVRFDSAGRNVEAEDILDLVKDAGPQGDDDVDEQAEQGQS
jgi:peroxiredoxin